MEPTQTALIVAVPEAEPAVGRFRSALDHAAGWGVPAHVTVLYPFLRPDQITDNVLIALGQVIEAVTRFEVAFTDVRWFEKNVVWLAPQPDDGFRRLTTAVWQRFPEAPPYGGAHTEVVPHLTIGHDAPVSVLRHAGETVRAHLPIRARVEAVRLIAGAPAANSWRTLSEFRLGPAACPVDRAPDRERPQSA